MTNDAAACLALGALFVWGRPERENRTPVNIGNQLYRDNGEGVA